MSVILSTEQLSRNFGGVKALNNLDLEVEEGQIFGVIGPNGAGKSTFFNVITSVVPATNGSVRFLGRDITKLKPHQIAREGIARTYQSIRVFRKMTVLENVLVALDRYPLPMMLNVVPVLTGRRKRAMEAKANDVIAELGLTAKRHTLAGKLHYVDSRRTEIARALATGPKLLLLDEPVAGMDYDQRAEIVEEIRKVRERGCTVILVEHTMEVVLSLCDRIAVLAFGEKIAEGQPQEISRDPVVLQAYLGEDDND